MPPSERDSTSPFWPNSSARCSGSRHGQSTMPTISAPILDGLKVGGHQASSASLATIMTALYYHTLRPQDRARRQATCVAEFPCHPISARPTAPRRELWKRFAATKGAQSYPSRTGRHGRQSIFRPARWAWASRRRCFSSLVQDYVRRARMGSNTDLKAARSRSLAMPNSTKAIFSKPCWKAGSRGCAVVGGSSITTDKASTPWSGRCFCGSVIRTSSPIFRLGCGRPEIRPALRAGGVSQSPAVVVAAMDR